MLQREPPFLNLDPNLIHEPLYIGRAHNLPPHFRGQLHRHTHYEIMWLAQGQATFFSDFVDYPLTPGSVTFVRPGQLHTWRGDWAKFDLIVISFKPEFLTWLRHTTWVITSLPYFAPTAPPYLQVTEPDQTLLDTLFNTIHHHYVTRNTTTRELLAVYLWTLLLEAKRLYQPVPEPNEPATPLIKAFYQAVEENFLKYRTTQAYAKLLSITPNHLTRVIRQATGTPPGKILRHRLLLETKRLLIHTDHSITEISDYLQFHSPAQFSNWFKRETTLSPDQFRKQFLQA